MAKSKWFGKAWARRKVAIIAFYVGRGYSSGQIAKIIADGTKASTIRWQWRRWGLPIKPGVTYIPVPITVPLRTRLWALAAQRRVSPEEWLRRVVEVAVDEDMFEAIVDEGE